MASLGFKSADASITMRNAVFRLVLTRAAATLDNPDDRVELEVAEAIGGISFDRLEPGQRLRIGNAVRDGLLQLQRDVGTGADLEEPVHPDIDEKLDELVAFMNAHLGHGDSPSI
jgi:hypothetical protein